jgi:hypothetical protein
MVFSAVHGLYLVEQMLEGETKDLFLIVQGLTMSYSRAED